MPIGPVVRRLFGPYEHRIAELYRSYFVDLDALVARIVALAPDARSILEVGCGEGAMAEAVVAAFPSADVLAIDITPRVGRLYRGDRARVTFRQVPVETVARERSGEFDLVLLCDVLHHVPASARVALLEAIRTTMAPGGFLVVKDWAPGRNLRHYLCEASDRILTGDAVHYLSPPGMRALLDPIFGTAGIVAEETALPPSPNNYLIAIRRPA